MTRHGLGAVLIPPFCNAIRSPVSSTGLNNRTILFYPPAAPSSIATGSTMRSMLAPGGPAHPSRHHLEHMNPSSPIEKHVVLQPTLYSGCLFLHYSLLSTKHAQSRHSELSRGSQRWEKDGQFSFLARVGVGGSACGAARAAGKAHIR